MRDIGGVALYRMLDSVDDLMTPPQRIELACQIVERQSAAPVASSFTRSSGAEVAFTPLVSQSRRLCGIGFLSCMTVR
jgi:hypothetical protein